MLNNLSNTKILGIILTGLLVISVLIGVLQFNKNKDISMRLNQKAPLPENIQLDMTSTSPHKDLIGVWEGIWEERNPDIAMTSSFVIKDIDKNGYANVVYSWGDNENLLITKGFVETVATIKEGTIDVKLGQPLKFTLLVEEVGGIVQLRGIFDNGYATVGGIFKKSQ